MQAKCLIAEFIELQKMGTSEMFNIGYKQSIKYAKLLIFPYILANYAFLFIKLFQQEELIDKT